MANLSRFILSKSNTVTNLLFSSRSFITAPSSVRGRLSPLYGFRPASCALAGREFPSSPQGLVSNEIILPEQRHLKPWWVEMRSYFGYNLYNTPRDEIISLYIKTLAQVVGCSEEEAAMKIYSISTKYYFSFGAFMSVEHAHKLKNSEQVCSVFRESLEDVENKRYGDERIMGDEPFTNGEAIPYDPKYHEQYLREKLGDDVYEYMHGNGEVDTGVDEDGDENDNDNENENKQVIPWIVRLEKPKSHLTRDEIIDRYIETLSYVVDSVDEARMMIYSVSTRCHYAFQIVANGLVAKNLEGLPGVKDVLAYFDEGLESEDFKLGEPFINGKAVPYDPKYHEGVSCNVCPEFDWFNNKRKDEPAMQKRGF